MRTKNFARAFAGAAEAVRQVLRLDGWSNVLTGIGTSRDRRTFTTVRHVAPIHPAVLEALFCEDDLAARIVEALPLAAFRHGVPVAEDSEGKIAEAVARWDLVTKLRQASIWGRLYGGGYLFVGTRDRNQELPLGDLSPGDLLFVDVLDRQDLVIDSYYRDPLADKFGKPEFYRIHKSSVTGEMQASGRIHESRLILFGGALTPERVRQRNDGYDLSVLQRPYETLRDVNDAWSNVMILFQDLSQAVFKVQGLIDMIAEGQKDKLQDRMEIVNMSRSVARAVMIDAEMESFEHVGAANVTGVDALLVRVFQRLAAAARMPLTILLGISPAGMNATGESDFRGWYDSVDEFRTEVQPNVIRALTIVAQDAGIALPDGLTVEWPSLWQYTDAEKADIRTKIAASDVAYISAGVVPAPAVALARWGSGKWSADRLEEVLDVDVLEKLLEAETADLLDPPEPPPMVQPPPPGQEPPPPLGPGQEPAPEDDPDEDA